MIRGAPILNEVRSVKYSDQYCSVLLNLAEIAKKP